VGRINVKGVIVGIALIQLYAAIRPRFGAGPATAVKAGILLAAAAGAKFYKEP
jgi:hypothetical protein